MLILEVYKTLLTEAHVDACVKNFGYELFGHELGGTETNTAIENSYVQSIEDFSKNMYGKDINPKFVSAMNKLKGCMKEYPEVLTPENTQVYRGLTIPIKYFADKKEPIEIRKAFTYTYKATNPIQSWSTDYEAASLFGKHDSFNELVNSINLDDYQTPEARQQLLKHIIDKNIRIAFTLEYHTNPQEFMFKSKYFRMISNVHYESEIIRFDNHPINVLAKFNDSPDIFSYKGVKLIYLLNKAIAGA